MIDPNTHWWPLAPLSELNAGQPLSRSLHGVPLVLFQGAAGQPAVLLDRCPHRHAPLSCGRVHEGEIACPYHGWRFAADGRCTQVPGLLEPTASRQPLVRAFASRVAHGLVWACADLRPDTPDPVGPASSDGQHSFFMSDTLNCGLAEAAENLLDGFHTPFVHAGWIRRDGHRQSVRAQVSRLSDGVQARYSEEGLQSGLISRWFEGERSDSWGRFHLPGVAELEYRSHRGLNLLVTAWFTPEAPGRLRVHARLATRQGRLPAWLKQLVLQRLFGVILRQDKAMLERTALNAQRFAELGAAAPPLDSALDLLGPSIRRLLAGQGLDDSVQREQRFRL